MILTEKDLIDKTLKNVTRDVIANQVIYAIMRTAKLTPRERCVICAKAGVPCYNETLRERGIVLGVTSERARQIYTNTMRKLRKAARRLK